MFLPLCRDEKEDISCSFLSSILAKDDCEDHQKAEQTFSILRFGLVLLFFLFDIKAFACLCMHVSEPRTDTGSVLFSYFTCLDTTTFIFLNLFALMKTIGLKIGERPMSCPAKCSLPVAIPGSKSLHA